MKKKIYVISASLLLLNGCASVAERNPNDPYERYNRTMFKFNDKADQYVMKPVARGYQKFTPTPVRTVIGNFFDNLRDVVSVGSNVLRGDMGKAGHDFARVAVNSTLGMGGLFNIADAAGMKPSNKNTLGDTFASWGWKNSHYFVVPLLGPSTVRDTVGSAVTTIYPIEKPLIHDKIVRYTLAGTKAVDTRARLLPITDMVDQMAMDKYIYTRDAYMALRNKQVNGEQSDEAFLNDASDDEPSDEPNTHAASEPTPSTSSQPHSANTDDSLHTLSQQIWQYPTH